MNDTPDFIIPGFSDPTENWSKLPHELINLLPLIDSLAELKVILYILRHTWGYGEYERAKHITTDEFEHGRKRKDGSRIDKGIGMSEPSIRDGLKRALKHGFIIIDVDDRDSARIVKSYKLNSRDVGEINLPPEGKEFTPRGKETLPRSEKETIETKPRKKQPAPKRDGYPKRLSDWKQQDMDRYYAEHDKDLDLLVMAWGCNGRFKDETLTERRLFVQCYTELNDIGFPTENYVSLASYTRAKLSWKGEGMKPTEMLTMVSAWRGSRLEEKQASEPRVKTKLDESVELQRMMAAEARGEVWNG